MAEIDNNKITTERVTVITVTYGNRKHMLEQMIDACKSNQVSTFVVVNNGASWDLENLHQHFPHCKIDVIDMQGNKGPAQGYKVGIQKALENKDSDLLWLLDDDLAPQKDCLENLLNSYMEIVRETPKENVMVLASRPEFVDALITNNSQRLMNPRFNTFLEFSTDDIWCKIHKRMPLKKRKVIQISLPAMFSIQMAPYGGLLFHNSVVKHIGLPDSNFILYVDDYEYTYRITQNRGRVMLIPSACLRELQRCWNSGQNHSSSFHAWLSGSDFRAYYSARNMTYFERHIRKCGGIRYYLNKYIYLMILYVLALSNRRTARFKLLLNAIKAGSSMHLGPDSRFPLP